MRAMVLEAPGEPLQLRELESPSPGRGQLRVRVHTCGVCRTDLHVLEGDLTEPRLPLVLGHEIVGRVDAVGEGVEDFAEGDRVGIPWLGHTCGACDPCRRDQENLCENALFTGYTRDGGYAELTVADARFCFPLPDTVDDLHAAPLLCAGLIGFRSYRMAQGAHTLGLYGFGAAAHILAQLAVAEGRRVFAFTRPGDEKGQHFARRLGAEWAGGSDEAPPAPLDAALLFAPVGALVPEALRRVRPGGRVVCAGIHMSEIPAFDYALLWEERQILSVANLTRGDGIEFFRRLEGVELRTHCEEFPLEEANEALRRLSDGEIEGAAVLRVRD